MCQDGVTRRSLLAETSHAPGKKKTTIKIYLLDISANVGSFHQELNSGMTSSSAR